MVYLVSILIRGWLDWSGLINILLSGTLAGIWFGRFKGTQTLTPKPWIEFN